MINPVDSLRPRNFLKVTHWKIRSQIAAIVLGVVLLSVVAMTTFSYMTISNTMTVETGQYLSYSGDEILGRISDIMASQINTLEALALSPAIIEAVEEANQSYDDRNPMEIEAEIAKLDEAWLSDDPSIEALVNKIEKNEVSDYLRHFMSSFPEEAEIFITDSQ